MNFQMEDIHHGLLGEVIDVDTTTVFFDEERHEDAIEQAYQVITVDTVENVVREGKLQFAVNAVRFIEQSYLVYFFFLYHIRVILAPIAFRRPSMF